MYRLAMGDGGFPFERGSRFELGSSADDARLASFLLIADAADRTDRDRIELRNGGINDAELTTERSTPPVAVPPLFHRYAMQLSRGYGSIRFIRFIRPIRIHSPAAHAYREPVLRTWRRPESRKGPLLGPHRC